MATLEVPNGLSLTQNNPPLPSLETETTTFLSALAATGYVATYPETYALNELVVDLKAGGVWNDLHTFYPFIGGASGPAAYNLIDPTQYTISWASEGGSPIPNFDYRGFVGTSTAEGNGGYGDTGFVPSSDFTINQAGAGAYVTRITQLVQTEEYYLGLFHLYTPKEQPALQIGLASTTNMLLRVGSNSNSSRIETTPSNYNGLWSVTKNGSSTLTAYQNGVSYGTSTDSYTPASGAPNDSLFIGAISLQANTLRPYRPTRQVLNFCYIDKGLDATQMANLYTAGEKFVNLLGRKL